MDIRKPVAVLALVGAVAALVMVGTAFAQTPTPTPGGQAKANYQQFFLDRLASALGTTTDKLKSAFTQARNETVDQQVKDGRLTQQQADQTKARQDAAPFGFGPGGFGPGGFGPGDFDRGGRMGGPGGLFMGGSQVHDAIARALGMTSDELTNQLRAGKSLAELAKGKEQAVKDAVAAAMKAQLDEAVKNGRLTQDQANQMLDRIRNSDLNQLAGPHGRGGPRGDGGQQRPAPGARPSLGPATPGASAL